MKEKHENELNNIMMWMMVKVNVNANQRDSQIDTNLINLIRSSPKLT